MRLALGLAAISAACAAALAGCSEDRSGPATVTVLAGPGAPRQGLQVLFHDRHGFLSSRVLTDADGKATAAVAPGALATVAWAVPPISPGFYALETVAELNPGDAVVVGTSTRPAPVTIGRVDVTLPGAYAGATGYRVDIGCTFAVASAANVPVPVSVVPPCGTAVSAVALAFVGDSLLAFSFATDVPLSGAAPALAGSIALPAWRTDFGSLALTASNPPAGGSSFYASLRPRRNGTLFYGSGAPAMVPAGGSAVLALPFVPGLGTLARLTATLSYAGGLWIVLANDVDLGSPRTLDLGALPPRLSAPSVWATGGDRMATWTSAGTDPSLDAQVLDVSWTDGTLLPARYYWTVTLPPRATSFTFPRIPGDLGAWLPPPGLLGTVSALDVSTVAGYAAFKATCDTAFYWAPPEAGSYTLRVSTAY